MMNEVREYLLQRKHIRSFETSETTKQPKKRCRNQASRQPRHDAVISSTKTTSATTNTSVTSINTAKRTKEARSLSSSQRKTIPNFDSLKDALYVNDLYEQLQRKGLI